MGRTLRSMEAEEPRGRNSAKRRERHLLGPYILSLETCDGTTNVRWQPWQGLLDVGQRVGPESSYEEVFMYT